MAGFDISNFTEGDMIERIQLALHILGGGDLKGKRPQPVLDVENLIENTAFIAAMMLESSPSAKTPQNLRHGAEEFGKFVHGYAKALRAYSDEAGQPLLFKFGGTGPVTQPI